MGWIERFDTDHPTGRELFVLSLSESEELPSELELPSEHFACLLAWDSTEASIEQISVLAMKLLRSGAAYFVCWGDGCERLRNIIDNAVSSTSDKGEPRGSQKIIASWHSNQPLSEAILFFLRSVYPDKSYKASLGCSLGVSVASTDISETLREAFRDPQAFVDRVSDSQDNS
jgi:hypothetical protein